MSVLDVGGSIRAYTHARYHEKMPSTKADIANSRARREVAAARVPRASLDMLEMGEMGEMDMKYRKGEIWVDATVDGTRSEVKGKETRKGGDGRDDVISLRRATYVIVKQTFRRVMKP